MVVCKDCNKENQPHYRFCLGCGAQLPRSGNAPPPREFTPPASTEQRCGYCTLKVSADAARCPHCNAPL